MTRKVNADVAWSASDSWVTNVTAIGAVLTGVVAASGSLSDVLPGAPLGRVEVLSFTFAGLLALGPVLYAVFARVPPTPPGAERPLTTPKPTTQDPWHATAAAEFDGTAHEATRCIGKLSGTAEIRQKGTSSSEKFVDTRFEIVDRVGATLLLRGRDQRKAAAAHQVRRDSHRSSARQRRDHRRDLRAAHDPLLPRQVLNRRSYHERIPLRRSWRLGARRVHLRIALDQADNPRPARAAGGPLLASAPPRAGGRGAMSSRASLRRSPLDV